MKDGKGYDIRSFNENGDEIFIEVKTTTRGPKSSFYMSRNEKNFAEQNKSKYVIYRLFNYDKNKNTAQYFILSNVIEDIKFEPIQYVTYIE
jgi:hypothetical protein